VSSDTRGTGPDRPLISVIVPTRDRPKALTRCLGSLAAQTVIDRLEVIVVDDGSFAANEVASIAGSSGCTRLIRRDGRGPAAARNAGARAAQGLFLCFTDDDCAPLPDWAERLVEALEAGADAAAGVTLSGGGALADASELIAHAPAGLPLEGGDLPFAPTNNIACTRKVFQSIQFDESFPGPAGEDRDWCARLALAGYVLRSEPRARIVHHQVLTFSRFLRQQFGYGQGAYRFRRRSGELRRLEPPSFYAALVRRGFSQGLGVGLLVAGAQLVTAAGFAFAWAAQRRTSRSVMDVSSASTSGADESPGRSERP
jgi:glycosyltransferase involved in cell wall biosynthesis